MAARKRNVAGYEIGLQHDSETVAIMKVLQMSGDRYVKQAKTSEEKEKRSAEIYKDSVNLATLATLAKLTVPTDRSLKEIKDFMKK